MRYLSVCAGIEAATVAAPLSRQTRGRRPTLQGIGQFDGRAGDGLDLRPYSVARNDSQGVSRMPPKQLLVSVLILGIVIGILTMVIAYLLSGLWHRWRLRRFAFREYRQQAREKELEAAMRISDRRPGFYLGEWYPR